MSDGEMTKIMMDFNDKLEKFSQTRSPEAATLALTNLIATVKAQRLLKTAANKKRLLEISRTKRQATPKL